KTWENEAPRRGNLSLLYVCAPEFAETDFRLSMAAIYGNWNVDFSDLKAEAARIEWWMSLEETPSYMQEMAIYLLHQFESLPDSFRYLDKLRVNSVTMKMCNDRILKLGVAPQFADKIQSCFRFLDRTREGTLSWVEYKVLSDIWSEMFLGLEEFLFFLRRLNVHQSFLRLGKERSMLEEAL
ncbi:unnamed protein product, partial [Amoebophrya sp. A25]